MRRIKQRPGLKNDEGIGKCINYANKGKFDVRQKAVIETYRSYSGNYRLPIGRVFYSLCNRQYRNNPLSELNQLVNANLIKLDQYIGIDRDESIISENNEQFPESRWRCGDWIEVFKLESCKSYLTPGIIYYDSTHEMDNNDFIEDIAVMMDVAVPETLLVVSASLEKKYSAKPKLEHNIAYDKLKKMVVPHVFNQWKNIKVASHQCFSYVETDGRFRTEMGTFCFWKE